MQVEVLETPNFSDATAMVEACFTELLRSGFAREADSIRGLEVYSLTDAQLAIGTLEQIVVDDEGVNSALKYTKAILGALIQQERFLAQAN